MLICLHPAMKARHLESMTAPTPLLSVSSLIAWNLVGMQPVQLSSIAIY